MHSHRRPKYSKSQAGGPKAINICPLPRLYTLSLISKSNVKSEVTGHNHAELPRSKIILVWVIRTALTMRIKFWKLPNLVVPTNSLNVFPKVLTPISIVPFPTTIQGSLRVPRQFSDDQLTITASEILVVCDP